MDNQWNNTPPQDGDIHEKPAAATYLESTFNPLNELETPPKLKHSGPGIASFSLFGAMAVLFIVLVIAIAVRASNIVSPDGQTADPERLATTFGNAPELAVMSFLLFGTVIGNIIGLILGIVGLVQKQRKKVFAILGTVLNGLVVGLLVFFIIIVIAVAFSA